MQALDANAILQAHNTYRATHQAGALAWSASLVQAAQNWANTCPSGHSPNRVNVGENIRWSSGLESEANIVASWYNERPVYEGFSSNYTVNYPMTVDQFNVDNSNPATMYGHFTQVVWRSTTQLGCAQATCNIGWRYVTVCQYAPAGNSAGQFLANVKAPSAPVLGTGPAVASYIAGNSQQRV
jgi:uncharacterized protein YkwD